MASVVARSQHHHHARPVSEQRMYRAIDAIQL
jgi:hypothetical protein